MIDCEGISCLIFQAGVAMNSLAQTYRALGRHADALAMRERTLEFQCRVLPADHPNIGEGCMCRDALLRYVR